MINIELPRCARPLRALSTATTNKHPMHAAFKYHEFTLSPLKSYYRVLIMAKHNFMRCPSRTDAPPPNGVTPLCGPLRYVCTVCKSYAVRMRCARDPLRPARPAGAHPARALSSRSLALAAARPSPVERVGQLGLSSTVVPCISPSNLPRRDRIASAVSKAAHGPRGHAGRGT